MIKTKKLISTVITTLFISNIMPTQVFAVDKENYKNIPTPLTTYTGTTGLADTTILPPLPIAPFTMNGDIAFCMQGDKAYPVNELYYANGNYDNDPEIMALLYYGYPNNKSGLREKHGLTEAQARGMTQFALWWHTTPGYFADKSSPYLDELRALGDARTIPSNELRLSSTTPNVGVNGSLQVSDVITTSNNYTGTFTFPSDANIYSTDLHGNKKNTFNIGESFKVVAVSSVKGSVTKSINYTVTQPTMLKYSAYDSTYQDFGVPCTKTTTLSKNITLTFPGVITTGNVTVVKTDDGGNPLAGVEFGVYSDSAATNLIEKKSTGADGRVTFTGLNVGTTYYVKEIKGIAGYVMDTSIKNVVIATTPQELQFTNTKIMGQIKVIKSEAGKPDSRLKGAEFQILNAADAVVDTIVTGDDGTATSIKLPYGLYKIRESKAPTGYILNNAVVDINITEHNKVYETTYENTKIMGQIKVIKSEAGKPDSRLKGAEFQILNAADAVVDTIVTGDDGTATSIKLPYGSYKLKESKAPTGYTLSNVVVDINITEHNRIYETTYDNNFIKGTIEIIKKDFDNNKPLEDVKFGIYNSANDNLIEEIITNVDGKATSSELRYGEYYIKELETKEGYVLDNSKYTITISDNLKVYPQEIFNERIKGDLTVYKYDEESKVPLSNVQFIVECLEGFDKGKTWDVTTDDYGYGYVNTLNYGKYQVTELKTIEGYVLNSTPIPFEVKTNGEIVKVEMSNIKIYGELQFEKIDTDTKEILSGAQIKIEGVTEFNKDMVIEFESSVDGNVFVLPYGKYNIYETVAPDGYVLNSSIGEFEITVDGEVVNVQIENKKKQGNLEIYKVSENTKKPLEGAVFGIYDKDKKLIVEVTSDKNGMAVVQNLDCGQYFYGELKAPEGYLVDLNLYDFELTEDGQTVKRTVYNRLLNPFPDMGDDKNPLPDTSGANIVVIIASILAIAASGMLLIRKKSIKR